MGISKNERPVVLALALDTAGSSERIVIGGEYEVCARLEGREDAAVLFDEKRPLGTFLFEHEGQLDQDWNANAIYPLKMALGSVLGRQQQEHTAWEFLAEKQNSHDPVCIFTAAQCLGWYAQHHSVLGSENVASRFEEQIMGLTKSFKKTLWGNDQDYAISHVLERMEGYMAVNCRTADTQPPAQKRTDLRRSAGTGRCSL